MTCVYSIDMYSQWRQVYGSAAIPNTQTVFYDMQRIDMNRLIAVSNTGEYFSSDNGESWFEQSSNNNFTSVIVIRPDYMLAAGNGLFSSNDGGLLWGYLGFHGIRTIRANSDKSSIVAYGGFSAPCIHSSDSGSTWVDIPFGSFASNALPLDDSTWIFSDYKFIMHYEPRVKKSTLLSFGDSCKLLPPVYVDDTIYMYGYNVLDKDANVQHPGLSLITLYIQDKRIKLKHIRNVTITEHLSLGLLENEGFIVSYSGKRYWYVNTILFTLKTESEIRKLYTSSNLFTNTNELEYTTVSEGTFLKTILKGIGDNYFFWDSIIEGDGFYMPAWGNVFKTSQHGAIQTSITNETIKTRDSQYKYYSITGREIYEMEKGMILKVDIMNGTTELIINE